MSKTVFEAMTVAELKEYAAEYQIPLTGAKTKAQILEKLGELPNTVKEHEVDEDALDVDTYELPVVEDDTDDRYPAFIAGSTLIVRLEDPGEIRIPLKLTYATVKAMREEMSPDADELDQLAFLLEKLGDDALLKTLTEDVDMADAVAISVLFFRAWKQRSKVSLGKLRRSSRR